jgi:hypothetical protein
VTSTSSIQANPYLFVFGANPLGYLEFKALDNTSSLSASSKYLQVNGSTAEIEKTMAILSAISTYETTGVMYAELEAAMAMDGKVDITQYGPTTIFDGSLSCSSGSGSGSGDTNQDEVIVDTDGSYLSVPDCSSMDLELCAASKVKVNDAICKTTPSKPIEKELSSIADLERQMIKYANNKPSGGVVAMGETGVFAAEFMNGKIIAMFINGSLGSVQSNTTFSPAVYAKYKMPVKALYEEHVHDIKTCLSSTALGGSCWDSKTSKEIPAETTIPSQADITVDISHRKRFPNYTFISRVFAYTGKGVEYEAVKDGLWWGRIYPKKDIDFLKRVWYKAEYTSSMVDHLRKTTQEDIAVANNMYLSVINNLGIKTKLIIAGGKSQ